MPNKMNIDKRFISFSVMRSLFYQLTQAAEMVGETRSDLCSRILQTEMDRLKIELTEENKEKIKDEVKRARGNRGFTYDGR